MGYPTSIPYTATRRVSEPHALSWTHYDFSNDAIELQFEHMRNGKKPELGYNSYDSLSEGWIYFSVDRDVDYVIEGSYQLSLSGQSDANYWFNLQDHSTFEQLFDTAHYGRLSESYVLGQPDEFPNDVHYNISRGARTGTLFAGRPYELEYLVGIGPLQSTPTAGPDETANGHFRIRFIPRPSASPAP